MDIHPKKHFVLLFLLLLLTYIKLFVFWSFNHVPVIIIVCTKYNMPKAWQLLFHRFIKHEICTCRSYVRNMKNHNSQLIHSKNIFVSWWLLSLLLLFVYMTYILYHIFIFLFLCVYVSYAFVVIKATMIRMRKNNE